jgi:hypothetical protein
VLVGLEENGQKQPQNVKEKDSQRQSGRQLQEQSQGKQQSNSKQQGQQQKQNTGISLLRCSRYGCEQLRSR